MTYVIKSQGHYKIGKTMDLGMRLRSFNTHCFDFKLVKLIYSDIEALLHVKFAKKRVKLEWFKLTKKDLAMIDKLLLELGDIESSDYDENWEPRDTNQGKKIFSRESRRKMAEAAKNRVSKRGKKIASITECGDIIEVFTSAQEAADSIGKTPATIRNCCKNKTATLDGHRFSYV